MINAVTGQLVSVNARTVLISANGIEFEIAVSTQCATRFSRLQGPDRISVRILTWLQHKEDSMSLFGFYDEEERSLFTELIKVNGIGPRQAMKILSGIKVSDFITALNQNDINFLSKVPGLGAKTSQKIILALRDTLVPVQSPERLSATGHPESNAYQDIVDALIEMGYERKRIIDTVEKFLNENKTLLEGKSRSMVEEWLFRNVLTTLG